jgi:methionyl-tRNA formyltransferase
MVSGTALRIVFFGTPDFAVPTLARLLESRHHVCGVITQPDRPRGRGQRVQHAPVKAHATAHQIPVFQPDRLREADVEAALRSWSPDLGVVAAYGKLIPENLLTVPRFGMINVHASLLPKYRGAAPVHRAVIDGETETGVTIMRVVKALDAGGMFARIQRLIAPDETSVAVERDLARLGAALLHDVVEQIAAGTSREEPQDDRFATYAARLTKEEGLVDWGLPSFHIHNRVRGLYPWPHAYTFLGSERLILLDTAVLDDAGEAAGTGAPPGTVIEVSREAIHVATGGGGRIGIRQLQPDARRPMAVRDFLSGHPVTAGARLAGR